MINFSLIHKIIRERTALILIPITFVAVLVAPLVSFSPVNVISEIPAQNAEAAYALADPVSETEDTTGDDACPAEEPDTVYFDPDDYEIADYSRGDYVLINRGSDPDPESLLFGTVDEADMEGGLVAPPDMTFKEDDTTIYVHYGTLNLRALPTADSEILHVFKLGDSIKRTGIGAEWSKVVDPQGREGYVFNELTGLAKPTPTPTPTPKYTAPAKANTLGEAIALEAQRYLGVKYRWAQEDPDVGFDCSGLTWYVFKRYGIETPRGTNTYWNAGTIVPYSEIAPGDVISWDTNNYDGRTSVTHVGIYIGKGVMVHASSSKGKVVKVSVAEYKKYEKLLRVHRFYKN